MSTSLSQENELIAGEAHELCDIIDANLVVLRRASHGRQFCANGARFRLRQRDRNVVYRVEKRFRWFLKMPTDPQGRGIGREAIGAAVVRDALAAHPGYAHAPVVRAVEDRGYLLSSEFAATQLNLVLYRACFVPLPGFMYSAFEALSLVGDALARLHGVAGEFDTARSRGRFAVLAEARALARQSHPIQRVIGEWACEYAPAPLQPTFIHGNFTARNVLVSGTRFRLVDFENCGSGNRYEDLSLMGSHLLLLRAVPLIPRRRASFALSSFLDGYHAVRAYDAEILGQYMAMQLCQYYIRAFLTVPPTLSARIAGLPVVRERLERLIVALIRTPQMLPEIAANVASV
jgi:aminoglycoside phosphotransferase (APT) family kinase protein